MDAGAGYGICCANDLVVVDVDEKEYIEFITNILPETMWQLTGSREGYHLFYKCPDLNTRITMKVNVPDNHCYAEGIGGEFPSFSRHIGEVKCDPHGYVVGPGSVHPSGNKYGPLKGEEISEVSKEDIKDALEPLEVGSGVNPSPSRYIDPEDYEVDDETDTHEFYELSADDVLPWLEPEKRIAHPIHGSTTGSNFMKNPDGHTFTCWRCQYGTGDGCGLSGAQFLAVRETGSDCEDVRRRWHDNPELHYHSWNRAVEDDIIDHEDPPFRVLLGYANHIGYADDPEEISGEAYWTLRKALEYEQTCM